MFSHLQYHISKWQIQIIHLPIVGIVVTISPSLSLYKMVVLPAASSPTIRMRISFFPNILLNTAEKTAPIFAVFDRHTQGTNIFLKENNKTCQTPSAHKKIAQNRFAIPLKHTTNQNSSSSNRILRDSPNSLVIISYTQWKQALHLDTNHQFIIFYIYPSHNPILFHPTYPSMPPLRLYHSPTHLGGN